MRKKRELNEYRAVVRGSRGTEIRNVVTLGRNRKDFRRQAREEWPGGRVLKVRLIRYQRRERGRWLARWFYDGWCSDPNWIGHRQRHG